MNAENSAYRTSAVTPEMRKMDRRRRRHEAVRHWLRCQWGRTGYRPTQRLLHRLGLCQMTPVMGPWGSNGEWQTLKCGWCGVSGKRLDASRVVMPRTTDSGDEASS